MVKLIEVVCGECGCAFGMTEHYIDCRRRDHRTWYCPNGHARAYLGENTEEKLRRERNELKQRLAYKDDMIREAEERATHERNRANGCKGHATRITNRAKAGVCPCCNRTFQQLARHMATQHPEFTPLMLQEGATT